MTYEEAISYIHSIDWRGSRPGLSRVTELLEKLGDPQDSLKFIHVGGTNGKGSFCAMLSSILKETGLKTGLFTSPYIENFNERMMINGESIPDSELAELTYRVSEIADKMEDPPTEFELICAVAMLYFKNNACDIVVLEVGLGGRLDATNIIKNPVLSVITGIALDHTAILGDTISQITAEKAGIIKEGRPVLLGCASAKMDREEIKNVISLHTDSHNSPLYTTDISSLKLKSSSLDGSIFDYKAHKDVKIPLLGLYQPQNAANVLEAIDVLRELGYVISDEAIAAGLEKTLWKARFEKLSDKPLVFFDGAHNPQGVHESVRSIKHYLADQKVIIITGVMADKSYSEMVGAIADVASSVFTLKPDNPRALDPAALAEIYNGLGANACACDNVSEAVNEAFSLALSSGAPIVALGSLYMYNEVKNAITAEKKRTV